MTADLKPKIVMTSLEMLKNPKESTDRKFLRHLRIISESQTDCNSPGFCFVGNEVPIKIRKSKFRSRQGYPVRNVDKLGAKSKRLQNIY